MAESRVGLVLDSLGQPVREAMQSAAGMGFRQIEMAATAGPVDPAELSQSGRRELMHFVRGLGLQLSALGGDLGGGRFAGSADLDRRLDKTRQIITMAADLRVPIVTTHLGPVSRESLQRGHIVEAVQQLAEMADRTGTLVAMETAADPAVLAELLKRVNYPGLGTCYDPASLLMEGFDALSGVDPLAGSIVIARVRDALAGASRCAGREVPLGQGQIDMAEYLAALDQAGYRRVPFIRRTESDRPTEEIAAAKRRLETMLG